MKTIRELYNEFMILKNKTEKEIQSFFRNATNDDFKIFFEANEYSDPVIVFSRGKSRFLSLYVETNHNHETLITEFSGVRLSMYSIDAKTIEDFIFLSHVGFVSQLLVGSLPQLEITLKQFIKERDDIVTEKYAVMAESHKVIDATIDEIITKAKKDFFPVPVGLSDPQYSFEIHPKIDAKSFVVLTNRNIEQFKILSKTKISVTINGVTHEVKMKSIQLDFMINTIAKFILNNK